MDDRLTLTDCRVIALLAGDRERWPLAGDQPYVDFDLSVEALPVGTRLAVGEAIVEVSPVPTGAVPGSPNSSGTTDCDS